MKIPVIPANRQNFAWPMISLRVCRTCDLRTLNCSTTSARAPDKNLKKGRAPTWKLAGLNLQYSLSFQTPPQARK